MKTIVISSIFVVFALMVVVPSAFADHENVEVHMASGSSTPGCEETEEGCFTPSEVTIDVGSKVTWINDDAAHTVSSGDLSADPDTVGTVFDSGLFMAGKTFSYTFEEAGEFPYLCTVHPWMKGLVIVQEAHAEDGEEVGYATAMSTDGSVMIKIGAAAPEADEELAVEVEFTDADGNAIDHVNFDISATQDGTEVLAEAGQHSHTGIADFTTAALESDSPLDVQVTILGFGLPDSDPATWTGPIGETVSAQVVPEFGPIAMIILAVAIVSIVAVTARSKVIPRL